MINSSGIVKLMIEPHVTYRSGLLPVGHYSVIPSVDCEIRQGDAEVVGKLLCTGQGSRLWAKTPIWLSVLQPEVDGYIAVRGTCRDKGHLHIALDERHAANPAVQRVEAELWFSKDGASTRTAAPLAPGRYRLVASAACFVAQGDADIYATHDDKRLEATEPAWFYVPQGGPSEGFISVRGVDTNGVLMIIADPSTSGNVATQILTPAPSKGWGREQDRQDAVQLELTKVELLAGALEQLVRAVHGLSPHHIPSQAETKALREAIYIAQKALRPGEPR